MLTMALARSCRLRMAATLVCLNRIASDNGVWPHLRKKTLVHNHTSLSALSRYFNIRLPGSCFNLHILTCLYNHAWPLQHPTGSERIECVPLLLPSEVRFVHHSRPDSCRHLVDMRCKDIGCYWSTMYTQDINYMVITIWVPFRLLLTQPSTDEWWAGWPLRTCSLLGLFGLRIHWAVLQWPIGLG